MSVRDSELYEFGDFRLDVGEHKLARLDGHPNGALPEKAFQTLVYLVRNRGRLVSKDELLSAVWPDTVVEENNLGKAVHTIRHILGEKSGEQRFIETVPKHGYRFVADVRRVPHIESSTSHSFPTEKNHPSIIGVPSQSLAVSNDPFRNAFEAVQRARIKYCQMTAPTTLEARALISEALLLDPKFAPAYSLSAEVTTLEVIVGLKTPEVGFAEARVSIARARDLGADSADYFAATGYVDLIVDWDFVSGEKNLKKSLSLNPHYGPANRMLGEILMFQGLFADADVYIERAQVDDLTGIHNANILAISRFLERRYAEVIDVCDRMLALSPGHMIPCWTKCWAYEQMGRLDEAIAGYDEILRLPHGEPALRWAGYAYALAGNRAKALEIASRLKTAEAEAHLSPTHRAAIFAALGDLDNGILCIRKGLEIRDPFMLWIGTDPHFDGLRSDARFVQVLERVYEKGRLASEKASAPEPIQGRVPDRLPQFQITESGQHALVDLPGLREVIERLESTPNLGKREKPSGSAPETGRAGNKGMSVPDAEAEPLKGGIASNAAHTTIQPPKRYLRWLSLLAGSIVLAVSLITAYQFVQSGSTESPRAISEKRLTFKGGATRATISEDGRYAAVVQNSALIVFDLINEEERRLVPASGDTRIVTLAFGPGHSGIYFGTRPADGTLVSLFSIPIGGGEPTKVLDDIYGSLSFSPDGRKFTFVRRYSELNEFALLTADRDGTNISKLASSGLPNRFDAYPVWSPDGTRIACPTIRVDGGFHFTIALIETATGSVTFVPGQRWKTLSSLVWMSDSRRILLAGQDEGSVNAQVWELDSLTGKAERLTDDQFIYETIGGTPDGSELVAIKVRQSSHVWILGDQQTQLTAGFDNHDGVGGLAWAPDGSIFYHSRASGRDAIWRMLPDGSGATEITPDAAGGFAISPDGQLLVFQGKQTADHLGLQLMNLRDRSHKPLTQGVTALTPAFFPDGKGIAYSLYDKKHSLFEISIDAGEPKLLSDEFRTATAPSVSPSGRFIAFAASRVRSGHLEPGIAVISAESRQLVSMHPVGITIGSLYQEPTVQWSSDESEVYFIQLRGSVSNIAKLKLSDGTVSMVTNFADGRIFNFAVEPGGKRMLVARGLIERDASLLRINRAL